MSTTNSSLVEDIRFIFAECERIQKLGKDAFKQLPREDLLFCSLPHPSGTGMMICGSAATIRVAKLAKEAGRRFQLNQRVTEQTLRKPTEELLVQRFVNESRDVNSQQVDRLLAAVGRKARSSCTDITHLVPCYLMTVQQPNAFSVGPVTFHNRANFRRLMPKKLREYECHDEDRWMMASALDFYRKFDWVAEITVRDCDVKTSSKIAERTASSALDCLQLIFRAQNSSKMRIGGPPLRRDRRAGVTIDKDGKLHPHGSVSGLGQVNFPNNWQEYFEHPEVAHLLSLCGLTLEAAIDPDLSRPLSRRFLDAAQWFGEASRDESPATRVVKYVTSLERMVMTEERDDIAAVVSNRIAALCSDQTDSVDQWKWRDDAREVYNLRSRLVHGSLSPADPDIVAGAWTAARIAESTLLNALVGLGTRGLTENAVSTKRLGRWYNGLVVTHSEQNGDDVVKSA